MENMNKEELKQKATEAYLLQQIGTVFNATLLRTMFMHLCLYDTNFAENVNNYLQNVKDGTLELIEKSADKNVIEYMSLTLDDMVEDFKQVANTVARIKSDIISRSKVDENKLQKEEAGN